MSTVIEQTPEQRLPDRYEVVNGQVQETPPMSAFSGETANLIRDELTIYARSSGRGRSRNDLLFRLPLPEDASRNRAPDVAFISFERWPATLPLPYRGNPVDVVPNLMVEVASPTDDAEDLIAKAHEYLRAGAELVWLVFPRVRQLYAYTAVGTAPRLVTEADVLDGGTVLPGFSVPMAGLFPAQAVASEDAEEE
ncbi:Uma2 family endonuclease [Gemmata sp.]|uniref:Uma2 family endonuclease n=1 Tax=Gemmata sp. TaxID=1914242 RepID=UPI003F6EF992